MTNINAWPIKERPRERLKQSGVAALSDAELLAILLRTGLKGKDVLQLSRDILIETGGFRRLFSLSWDELKKVKGLGEVKIAQFLAVREIFSRQLREKILDKNAVQDPEAVLEYLSASMRDRKREVFKVLFLDKANHIIDARDLFEGTIDQTAVHPREVVKAALEIHATALILVHNHPSGKIEPSQEDRMLTGRLHSACAALGIRILDHLIVGDNQFFSFRENRLL